MTYVNVLPCSGLWALCSFGTFACSASSPVEETGAEAAGSESTTSTEATSEVSTDEESGTDSGDGDGDGDGETGEPPGPAQPGQFSFMTYNVAGLPEGLSSGDPVPHMPQISPLLNAYDLVVAQEDFFYHAELSGEAEHPHQSSPWSEKPSFADIGDGLNRFSQFPFELHERVAWYACHGGVSDCASDCLATKGWSYARHTIVDGFELDIYNLHHEAGGCDMDVEIRDQATDDLIAAVMERSGSRPVIIAGDYNLHASDAVDLEVLERMAEQLDLEDACWALDCASNSIDRVFFRGSDNVEITVSDWEQPAEFVDALDDNGPLSDHLPTSVVIHYAPTN